MNVSAECGIPNMQWSLNPDFHQCWPQSMANITPMLIRQEMSTQPPAAKPEPTIPSVPLSTVQEHDSVVVATPLTMSLSWAIESGAGGGKEQIWYCKPFKFLVVKATSIFRVFLTELLLLRAGPKVRSSFSGSISVHESRQSSHSKYIGTLSCFYHEFSKARMSGNMAVAFLMRRAEKLWLVNFVTGLVWPCYDLLWPWYDLLTSAVLPTSIKVGNHHVTRVLWGCPGIIYRSELPHSEN